MSPLLFISHSGADVPAARELRRRILAAPAAREAGLRVWFDGEDLHAGVPGWQEQLEKALEIEMTAFTVYVGSGGVMNWVEREVRAGLSRATGPRAIPFIPILSKDARSRDLPFFARQHQAIRDPLDDPDALADLLKAALGATTPVVLEPAPFVGLRSMTEAEGSLFFGREEETEAVLDLMRRHRLVAIVAESGAGKSSLVQAGIVPRFRGGALEDPGRLQPEGRIRHVLVVRPQDDPVRALRDAVTRAAETLGLSGEARDNLRQRIDLSDPERTAFALRCDLPIDSVDTLVVVDQFEELITQTPTDLRAPFTALLARLAEQGGPSGFRVLMTARSDYFTPIRELPDLRPLLTGESAGAVYPLKRITDAGIEEAIRRPLKLAGRDDEGEADALVGAVVRDAMDRPGDLALVQTALHAVWTSRKAHGDDLVRAYTALGGVAGALASGAETAREELGADAALLLPVMVRLIRLGTTGGVTRRVARLSEFDPPRHALIKRLSTDKCGRLLLVAEDTVEVAHEALITQWAWLNDRINQRGGTIDTPRDIRRLERLGERTQDWMANGEDTAEFGANGAELDAFRQLADQQAAWLSADERRFVRASEALSRKRLWKTRLLYGALAAACLAALAIFVLSIQASASLEARAYDSELAKTTSEARRALDNDDATGALGLVRAILGATDEGAAFWRGPALEVAYAGLQRRLPAETFAGELIGSRDTATRYLRPREGGRVLVERGPGGERTLAEVPASFGKCTFDYCADGANLVLADGGRRVSLPAGYVPFAPVDAGSLVAARSGEDDGYSSEIELFRIGFADLRPQSLGRFSGDPEWGRVAVVAGPAEAVLAVTGDAGDNQEGGTPMPGAYASVLRGDQALPLLEFNGAYFPGIAVFDAAGERLATAPGDPSQGLPQISVWDARTGQLTASSPVGEAKVADIAFFQDGEGDAGGGAPTTSPPAAVELPRQRVVVGTETGVLDVFDTANGHRVATLASDPGAVRTVDFDPVAQRLCALWSTGVVGIWDSGSLLRLERIAIPAPADVTGLACRGGELFLSIGGANEAKAIQRWTTTDDRDSPLLTIRTVPKRTDTIVSFGFDPQTGLPAIDYAGGDGDCTLRWIAGRGEGACGTELRDDASSYYGWVFRAAPADLSPEIGNGFYVKDDRFCFEPETPPTEPRCPVALEGRSVTHVQMAGEDRWFLATSSRTADAADLFVIDARTFQTVAAMEGAPFGLANVEVLHTDPALRNLFVFRADDTIQIWKLDTRSLSVEAQSRFIFQGTGWRTQALDTDRQLLATYGDGVVRTYRYDMPDEEIVRAIEDVEKRGRPADE